MLPIHAVCRRFGRLLLHHAAMIRPPSQRWHVNSVAREAITFATSDDDLLADDGSDIALALGLTVERYDRVGYKSWRNQPSREFCVCPTGTTIPIASAGSTVARRYLHDRALRRSGLGDGRERYAAIFALADAV